MNNFDGSALLRFLTSALGGNHPMRLTLGLALGVFAKMAINALAHSYPSVAAWNALDEFGTIFFMFAFAPVPFVPIIFSQRTAPEGVSHQISTIRALLDEEGATHAHRAMVWRSITSKYLAKMEPDLSRGPALQNLFKEATDELRPGSGSASA
jgi:hypothetical protein